MKHSTETSTYAQMGMAALIPGMQYMLERMQHELDEMRSQLALWQGNGAKPVRTRKDSAKSGWAGMTPEERSVEMKRRLAMGKSAERSAKRSAERKAMWAAMSKAKPKERVAKMQAGRRAKAERATA